MDQVAEKQRMDREVIKLALADAMAYRGVTNATDYDKARYKAYQAALDALEAEEAGGNDDD